MSGGAHNAQRIQMFTMRAPFQRMTPPLGQLMTLGIGLALGSPPPLRTVHFARIVQPMNTNAPIDAPASPQTTSFVKRVAAERADGLIDVKFFKRDTARSTVESFCGEVNLMLQAPAVPEEKLF